MNRRRGSLAGSPLLIGAVTALIAVVAVYISYNANHGLPFTPTYNIRVQLPSAANLFPGNDVRIGGTRVGLVEKLVPEEQENGHVVVYAYLKLEKSVQPLPADTTATVPSISSIGLKYLALERGTSSRTIPAGGEIPISQTHEQVDIGEFFDMFDKPTRVASQSDLDEFGAGLAGRGPELNEALGLLKPIVRRLTPVLHNLNSPQTDLANFFPALDRGAKEVAPVATQQGQLYADLDSLFGAWAGVAPSLEAAIVDGPSSLKTATESLPYQAKFVDQTAEFMRLLRPSAAALKVAAPPLGHAVKVGAVNLNAAVSLNSELAEAAKAVQKFAEEPIVEAALEDITRTTTVGGPLVKGLAAEQESCNYLTLTFRNAASLLSESIGVGTIARASVVLPPGGPNSEGYPASEPANGTSEEHVAGKRELLAPSNHLHYNPYPNAASCEAGNQGYTVGRTEIGKASVVAKNHEKPERATNLYGRPYEEEEPAVLKDLGIKPKASSK
ncbi:MAG: MlaD family protein [Solirubrobacteraceae bacterium]